MVDAYLSVWQVQWHLLTMIASHPAVMVAAAALWVSLLYRFRGGGLFLLPGETNGVYSLKDEKHTQIRRLTYAFGTGGMVYALTGHWLTAVGTALILFGGQIIGNGRPIGAAGGWEKKELEEWAPLDGFASFFTSKFAGLPTEHKRLWGALWFTGLGMLTAALLSLSPDYQGWGLYLLWLHGLAVWGTLAIGGSAWWGKQENVVGALYGAGICLALI